MSAYLFDESWLENCCCYWRATKQQRILHTAYFINSGDSYIFPRFFLFCALYYIQSVVKISGFLDSAEKNFWLLNQEIFSAESRNPERYLSIPCSRSQRGQNLILFKFMTYNFYIFIRLYNDCKKYTIKKNNFVLFFLGFHMWNLVHFTLQPMSCACWKMFPD